LAERGVSLKEWHDRLAEAALADEVVRHAVRSNVDIGRQEIQDYYWEHLPLFRHSDRKVLRQIFTKTRAEGEAALREVQLGEPFPAVAARRGQGPEAAQGGLLGPLSKAQLPKPLADAAQKLKAKQVSPLVRSPWGWHLLYVEALDPAEGDSLDQATPKAQARLLRDKEQLLYQLWLGRLREQAKIEHLAALAPASALAKTGSR
jgi:parvulin-like peptidyl-prolyl isomerase